MTAMMLTAAGCDKHKLTGAACGAKYVFTWVTWRVWVDADLRAASTRGSRMPCA